MSNENLKMHLVNRHGTEAFWLKQADFVPHLGETVYYDSEVDESGSILAAAYVEEADGSKHLPNDRKTPITYMRHKVGDGFTVIAELPFVGSDVIKYVDYLPIIGDSTCIYNAPSDTYGVKKEFQHVPVTHGNIHQANIDLTYLDIKPGTYQIEIIDGVIPALGLLTYGDCYLTYTDLADNAYTVTTGQFINNKITLDVSKFLAVCVDYYDSGEYPEAANDFIAGSLEFIAARTDVSAERTNYVWLNDKWEILAADAISPISFSSSEDSFIQKVVDSNHCADENASENSNNAYSPSSSAIGFGTTAGIKGYYWTYIDFENKYIYISASQPEYNTIADSGDIDETFENPYSIGDAFSVINGSKYPNCATIREIYYNRITFSGTLPFTSMSGDDGIDAYAFYVLSKPEVGVAQLGHYAHAEGEKTEALERSSHAEGRQTKAYGQYSHAEGRGTEAWYCAHAEGYNTKAINENAHSEGKNTVASGKNSHAEGEQAKAIGNNSHAEGLNTQAIGNKSHAEGTATLAEGEGSHAEGSATKALGGHSHAQGLNTIANNQYSFTAGIGTISMVDGQTVVGSYNDDTYDLPGTGNAVFLVGCGENAENRKTAFAVVADHEGQEGEVNVYIEPKHDNNVMTLLYTSRMIGERLGNLPVEFEALQKNVSSINNSINTLSPIVYATKSQTDALYQPWKNKRWFILGDEINYKYNDPYTTQYYHNFITDITGIEVYSKACSDGTGFLGSSTIDNSVPTNAYRSGCIPARIEYNIDEFDNADNLSYFDAITIFTSGKTDCAALSGGRLIGDPYSYDFNIYNKDETDNDTSLKLTESDTLCYRIHATITEVLKNCPNIQLVIATPIPYLGSNEYLEKYANVIIEVCHVRGVPCLDLYHNSSLQPVMENSYGPQLYNNDLMHLNADGHKKIAPRFKAMLDTLIL